MEFYTKTHKYACGLDLHARNAHVTILDSEKKAVFSKRIPNDRGILKKVLEPYKNEIIVSVESTFNWYWVADFCAAEEIPFVLGHAKYMKAVHQGKTKSDRIDSDKIARLTAAGMLPVAYAYPPEMRKVRDVLRRRLHLVRQRAGAKAHIKIVNSQYNLPLLERTTSSKKKRRQLVLEHFQDPDVAQIILADLEHIDALNKIIRSTESYVFRRGRDQNEELLSILKTVPGIGPILSLTLLYELHTASRFTTRQRFCSYARLIRGKKTSNGKPVGEGERRCGNPWLKWAFSEATVQLIKNCKEVKEYHMNLKSRVGKRQAIARLARKLGTSVFVMLKKKEAFDVKRFLNG